MKQLETEIAVVGAGTAGLAAAVASVEKGTKVAVFEKAATTGGTGSMGMGPFAVESRLQKIKQIGLTREQAFQIFMDYTHWRVDARLVSNYINKSAGTLAWLEQMGVEFLEPEAYFPGSNFTWHTVKSPAGRRGGMAAATMMKVLTERASEIGVKIFLQTPVKKILKESGRIVGLIAQDRNGEDIQAKAKAVIIASGGFGDNPEMIKKFTPYEWGKDLFSMRVPGMVGEGIRMAWEVGAGDDYMNMEIVYNMPAIVTNPAERRRDPATMVMTMLVTSAFYQPSLLVNLQGERFINEGIMGNTTFTGNAIARQNKRCAFSIFDDVTRKHYEEESFDHVFTMSQITKAENLGAILKQAIERGNENVFIANSVDELAHKTGVNPDGLRKTVDEYNIACATGRDEIFHKDPNYLRPVKQPPFYAARFFPSAYGTLGGIKINHRTEVLTKDFDVIPGLYASGVDANAIYGDSYVFVLPGNTMGFALNSGRMAGENASEYAKNTVI
jgi:fumarate reductase flavoprotein subunit